MLDTSKLVDSDKLAASHLVNELNAGSTRVYNIDRLHRQIMAAGAPRDEMLFRHQELHRVIFIKEALYDPDYQPERRFRVGTKLYFAFNEANAFEGGKSIFAGDPQFDDAMAFQFGLDPGRKREDYIQDRHIIQILDQLPSLDPFLVKDRLAAEEIVPNPGYFEVADQEWRQISQHVMQRFRPIIDMAFANLDSAQAKARLRSLVHKLWEARDMDALAPVIQAMELSPEDAPAALHAWKGVIYYDFRLSRIEARVRDFASWLAHKAEPADFVQPAQRKLIEEVRTAVRSKVRDRWHAARERLGEYNNAYSALFIEKRSPAPFIAFLGRASDIFNELGDELSRLDHAAEVRRTITDRMFGGRLKHEPLHEVLSLTYRILE